MENGTKRYIQTITWLAKLYEFANQELFKCELERPVITVQTDERNKAYGWFTLKKVWRESDLANDKPTINNSCDGCPMDDTCERNKCLMPEIKDSGDYEINMSAQFLNRPINEIAGTLIHEMCHQWAKENNIQDCSRGGSYHNKLFRKIAEEHGLKVENVAKIGWSRTSPYGRNRTAFKEFYQVKSPCADLSCRPF